MSSTKRTLRLDFSLWRKSSVLNYDADYLLSFSCLLSGKFLKLDVIRFKSREAFPGVKLRYFRAEPGIVGCPLPRYWLNREELEKLLFGLVNKLCWGIWILKLIRRANFCEFVSSFSVFDWPLSVIFSWLFCFGWENEARYSAAIMCDSCILLN